VGGQDDRRLRACVRVRVGRRASYLVMNAGDVTRANVVPLSLIVQLINLHPSPSVLVTCR
jgi:hypothetical protein